MKAVAGIKLVLLMALLCIAYLQAASAFCCATDCGDQGSSGFRQTLSEYDLRFPEAIDTFSEELSNPRNPGMFRDNDLLVDDLSEAEKALVWTYYPVEYPFFPIFTSGGSLSETLSFLQKHGRMPNNGLDMLLTNQPDWDGEAGLERLRSIREGDKLTILSSSYLWKSVNPVTGKLYESFDNPNWHSLGVFAEEIVEPEMIPSAQWSEEKQRYVSGLFPHKMIRIVVFGETPGRVLVDKKIGLMLEDFTVESKSCKCKQE